MQLVESQRRKRVGMKVYLITSVLLTLFGHFDAARSGFEHARPAVVESRNRFEIKSAGHVFGSVTSNGHPSPRIVEGTEAEPNSFPYAVFVKVYTVNETLRSNRICGGSLISVQWVLTAAHCLEDADVIFATAGAHDIRYQEWTQQAELVKGHIKHPDWEPKSASSDLALLKMQANFTLDGFVKAIRLPSLSDVKKWYWWSPARTAGWGIITKDDSWKPSNLLTLNSSIIANFLCSFCYGFGKIKDYHLCTDGSWRSSVYKGYSGDPLVVIDSDGQPTLVGVATRDMENGFERSCSPIFTRVTNYVKWISDTTGVGLRQ